MEGNGIIAYHGTTKASAELIKKTGFRKGTYFAVHKEDAVKFGGPFIFAVKFSDDPSMWHGEDIEGQKMWQFWIRQPISSNDIVEFTKEVT